MRLKVCAASKLDSKPVQVFEWTAKAGTKEGIVVKAADGYYACERYCPHDAFPLEFGQVIDQHTMHCTCHGSEFDLTTGAVTELPAKSPLKVYPVTAEGGDLYVEVPEE